MLGFVGVFWFGFPILPEGVKLNNYYGSPDFPRGKWREFDDNLRCGNYAKIILSIGNARKN